MICTETDDTEQDIVNTETTTVVVSKNPEKNEKPPPKTILYETNNIEVRKEKKRPSYAQPTKQSSSRKNSIAQQFGTAKTRKFSRSTSRPSKRTSKRKKKRKSLDTIFLTDESSRPEDKEFRTRSGRNKDNTITIGRTNIYNIKSKSKRKPVVTRLIKKANLHRVDGRMRK
eukprot:UN31929